MLILKCDVFLSSVSNFCFIAKQRINSGFFLFVADRKKKEDEKKNRKNLKKLSVVMESSDDEFMETNSLFFNLAIQNDKFLCVCETLERKNPPYNLELVISGLLLLLAR